MQWCLLQLAWSVFGLLLFAVTWRLWVSQDVYAQIPLIRVAGSVPEWIECSLAAVVLSVLAGVGLQKISELSGEGGRWTGWFPRRIAGDVFISALGGLFLIDQHRLQPWAYQLALIAIVLRFAGSPQRGLVLLRVLTISIYLYSAIGKFDYQFLHTVGRNSSIRSSVMRVSISRDGIPQHERRGRQSFRAANCWWRWP